MTRSMTGFGTRVRRSDGENVTIKYHGQPPLPGMQLPHAQHLGRAGDPIAQRGQGPRVAGKVECKHQSQPRRWKTVIISTRKTPGSTLRRAANWRA